MVFNLHTKYHMPPPMSHLSPFNEKLNTDFELVLIYILQNYDSIS
jgi:hypothetical protein